MSWLPWRKKRRRSVHSNTSSVYRVTSLNGTPYTVEVLVGGGTRSECERWAARLQHKDPGTRYFVSTR